jgi:hypothetical protein
MQMRFGSGVGDTARHLENGSPASSQASTDARSRAVVLCEDLLLPMAASLVVAFACLLAPRFITWIVLLALPVAFGYLVSRSSGVLAAASGALLYLWVHGEPRFQNTVTDHGTIRAAFALGLAGMVGAVVGNWRRRVNRRERVDRAEGRAARPVEVPTIRSR